MAVRSQKLHTSILNSCQLLKKPSGTTFPLSRNLTSPRRSTTSGFIQTRILRFDRGDRNWPATRRTSGNAATARRPHLAQSLTVNARTTTAAPTAKILNDLIAVGSG